MANWKKVIVSGSNAELLTVTASFFKGDGSALTGVVAASANALTAGSGLSATGTYDGSVARTFTVNSGSLLPFFSSSIFSTVSGDVTITSAGVSALATVASAGTTGGSTAIPVITINAKGLTTSITTAAVVAPAGTLSGATLASNVTGSSLTSVGTLAGLTATGTTSLATLTVSGDATVTGNLSVAGTASFTNADNLNIKDKFILINSGSSVLADSGLVTQYNAAGSGSAFYLEAASAGTYGRFAVAYDVVGTSTSLTPDEFVVTARVSASAAIPTNPTWGGSSNGSGNMFINSLTGDVYIYS